MQQSRCTLNIVDDKMNKLIGSCKGSCLKSINTWLLEGQILIRGHQCTKNVELIINKKKGCNLLCQRDQWDKFRGPLSKSIGKHLVVNQHKKIVFNFSLKPGHGVKDCKIKNQLYFNYRSGDHMAKDCPQEKLGLQKQQRSLNRNKRQLLVPQRKIFEQAQKSEMEAQGRG